MKRHNKKYIALIEKISPWIWVGGVCVMLSALSLANMSRWSIWFDEAFSAYIARFNFAEIAHFTALDVHPPLYYWLLHGWVNMFGSNEMGLRSMSLFWAVVAVVGLFILLQRMFRSSRWALAAATCVALSPVLIRFSHEARMYTLVLAIVVWATYCVMRMHESRQNRWWVVYGVLLAAGMYTHYFVALAWLAHWTWRWREVRTGRLQKFWTRPWIYAHMVAIALFACWIPTAFVQFTSIQHGFWIPPVSADTPADYISDLLLYLQYGEAQGWWSVLFIITGMTIGWLLWRAYPLLKERNSVGLRVLTTIAVVPPVLLFVVSLPPLASTFINRYVLYAQLMILVLTGLSLASLWQNGTIVRRRVLYGVASLLLFTSAAGISNVYYYGNYNKNSSTSIRVKEVMALINEQGEFGQPVIAASPWVYYEAAFYDSPEHRVYFSDEQTQYNYGSTKMLEERDIGKIKNLDDFTKRHRYVWVIDNHPSGPVQPLKTSWQRVKNVDAYDPIDKHVKYRASLFDTTGVE
jgi:mannosyltransferase